MRIARFALAPVVCALLAGCGSDSLTAPDAAPLADDVQCTETGGCGGGGYVPPPPAYYWGSDTNTSHAWKQFGPSSWAFVTIHKGNSWSEVVSSDYASGRVDATAFTYWNCRSGSQAVYQTKSLTVYGIGKAEVDFRFEQNTRYGFQVRGTHTFTGKPGVGNQVFYSEASHCDDSIV